MDIYIQILWLLLLAIPISSISWTVTHEELFSEPREYCIRQSKHCNNLLKRKFFYLFTCEYCFSHYITILFLFLTDYKLLLNDWRGFVISGFSLVWISNIYMSLFMLIRIGIKKDRTEIKEMDEKSDK
jgi:hypothetical protein